MGTMRDSVREIRVMFFGEDEDNLLQAKQNVQLFEAGEQLRYGPQYLMLKITNYCNSHCIYCYHAANKSDMEEKSSIPIEVLLDLIRQAGDLGVKGVTISGGEPLIRDDVEEIITSAVQNGIIPTLLTNGTLLTKARCNSLYAAGLRYFIISVDSLVAKDYEIQRGITFSMLWEGLNAVIELKNQHPEVHIHITPVVTRNNIAHIPNLVDFFSDKGIAVQLSPYHHFGLQARDELSVTDKSTLERVIYQLLEMKKDGALVANTDTYLKHIIPFFSEGKMIPDTYRCKVGFAGIFIDAYMNICPCWNNCFAPLGNLKTDNLRDIWFGERYTAYRDRMYSCDCSRCWLLCTGELTTYVEEL